MSRKRRRKKEKRPAWILRLVWRLGWKPGRVMSEVLEWIEVFAVAGALAALIMTFVTVRMHVPTGSMIPTIDPSDSFFVDRLTYHFRNPTPGSIVVFRHTEQVLVHRIETGSPADLAGVQTGLQLTYVNTEPVYNTERADVYLVSAEAGTEITLLTADQQVFSLGVVGPNARSLEDLGITTRENRMRYVKRLIAVGGQTVQIIDGDIYIDGEKPDDARFDRYYYSNRPEFCYGVEPTLVPEGCFFVLGDNSANSFDSRYWGFVKEADIIGVPYLRVWPLNRFGLMH